MELLSAELLAKYPSVSQPEIFDSIELAVMRVIEHTHQRPVSVVISDNSIETTLLDENAFIPLNLSGLKNRLKRRIINEIELELMERQAIADARYYRTIRGCAITGIIEHIQHHTGNLVVRLEFNDVMQPIVIYGECPVSQQPIHERGTYQLGSAMYFMVAQILPVTNGKNARARVLLSRSARELPARILTEITKLPGIRCVKRELSNYRHSRIVSRFALPVSAIKAVGKELKEHIDITVCPAGQFPTFKENRVPKPKHRKKKTVGSMVTRIGRSF